MKKSIFMAAVLAGAMLVACDKESTKPEGQDPNVPDQPANTVTHKGVTYKTVTLSNGQTWMAENLRVIPEGMTPNADLSKESHVYFPYKYEEIKEGDKVNKVCTALTDEASIAKYGYLYDYEAVFGQPITKENFEQFQGAQGICPDGWHVPTRAEFIAMCGYSVKSAEETEVIVDENALFYDDNFKKGSVKKAIEAGWGFDFAGVMNKTNIAAKPAYMAGAINCGVTEFDGQHTMNYYIASTGYKASEKDGNLTNIQFFGLMGTFNKSYPGAINVGYTNFKSGYSLRCIKDGEDM